MYTVRDICIHVLYTVLYFITKMLQFVADCIKGIKMGFIQLVSEAMWLQTIENLLKVISHCLSVIGNQTACTALPALHCLHCTAVHLVMVKKCSNCLNIVTFQGSCIFKLQVLFLQVHQYIF